jgi:ubiquinone/menaquinone biosynthesis C-methylase UbiE
VRDVVRERYYEHRAPVYDETSYRGDPVVNAGLDRESAQIGALLSAALPARRILDVGCGTGTWTGSLPGRVVAMDQSRKMLEITRARVPDACLVHSLFPPLPFPDAEFDLVFTANFYGLLRPRERIAFLAEARRVATELVVLDLRSDGEEHVEGTERREVAGTAYSIFRRRFTPDSLRAELGGQLIYTGRYFLVLRVQL